MEYVFILPAFLGLVLMLANGFGLPLKETLYRWVVFIVVVPLVIFMFLELTEADDDDNEVLHPEIEQME